MAARRHISPDQLRMFMPASELAAMNHNPADIAYLRREGQIRDAESYPDHLVRTSGRELTASVATEGVKQPVALWHDDLPSGGHNWLPDDHKEIADPKNPTFIANGNHRVALAASVRSAGEGRVAVTQSESVGPLVDPLVPVEHFGYPHHRFRDAVQSQAIRRQEV